MNPDPDFSSMFSAEDTAEIARSFAGVDAEDPEAALARNAAEIAQDPTLAWRQALSTACAEEGVSYQWLPLRRQTIFFFTGHHPVRVPDGHLERLQADAAHPHATACVFKAISIDPRLQPWDDDDLEELEGVV